LEGPATAVDVGHLKFNPSQEDISVLRKQLCFALITFFCSAPVFADQIMLNNGDRLSGKVVKSDGKTLVLHTEAAGDITIQFSAIQQITTEQELHVSTSSPRSATGSAGKTSSATSMSRIHPARPRKMM
jgi:hypothetical protein